MRREWKAPATWSSTALRAPYSFSKRDGEGDLRGLAGENDLAWAVEIRHADIRRGGEFAGIVLFRADDGSHAALSLVAGLLHGDRALGDKAQAGLGIKGSRGGVGCEFAERETCGSVEREARELLLENREAGEAVHVEGGLADGGLCQFLGGAFERDLGKRPSKDIIGAAEEVCCDRKFGGKRPCPCRQNWATLTGE